VRYADGCGLTAEGRARRERVRLQAAEMFAQDANPDWLTVIHLPPYAPDLNAVEGAWASMKSSLGNHAATTLDQLEALVRSRLRSIQRQPDLINALLGQTGLALEPPPA
jgi:transposase